MKRDQIIFVLLTPVILAAHVAAAASEAVRDFAKDYRRALEDLGDRD